MSDIEKYADRSMFQAAPMEAGNEIKVHLLWMTEDPLGAIAAACRMYEGKPTYSLKDITDEERANYAQQVQQTHLKAPLEFVKFHFFIEGVTRSFTHQMVRQRTAVFAQESMRFAVKDNFAEEAHMPPGIRQASRDIQDRVYEHNQRTQELYNYLIANGVPAEDARESLPHSTTTRLNYSTDLRNLADHSGNRLCTQAQFIWRDVFKKIVKSIAEYSPAGFELASLNLFKPVCYQLGHCPFQASFDRGCTIRERVDANAKIGRDSKEWDQDFSADVGHPDQQVHIRAIRMAEWMDDNQAAWQ